MTMRLRFLLLMLPLCLLPASVTAGTVTFDPKPPLSIDLPEALSITGDSPLADLKAQLESEVAQDPEAAEAWYRLGTVRFRLGDAAGARDAWAQSNALDDLYAPADIMEATQSVFVLAEEGRMDEARQALEQATEAYSSSPYLHLIRAEQAMRSRAFDVAEDAYRTAIEADPAYFAAKLNLARYLEYMGRQDEARQMYLAATTDAPDHWMTWDFLGAHQFSGGDTGAALASFERARTASPRQPAAEVRLAGLFAEARDNIGARYWYRQALRHAEPEARPAILASLGNIQLQLGLLDEATESLDAVIAHAPSAPILVARGYVAEESGDMELATRMYREAVKADPGNVVASNNLAMALIRMDANPEEALAHSRHALERRPENAHIGATYAVALAHAGEDDAALSALSRNARISPDDPWIRYFLGVLLHRSGQMAEARLHLEAVRILDPDFERLAEVQRLLSDM